LIRKALQVCQKLNEEMFLKINARARGDLLTHLNEIHYENNN